MKRSRTVVTAAAVAALSAVASPALAAQQTLQDAAGDASSPGLDITRVTVRNLDHAVVAKIRFVKSVRGDLIISLDPRAGRGVRLVSEYRPVAHTKNFVVAGAFTDRQGDEQPSFLACKGFRVRWSPNAPLATLRMPSQCLHGGDYGAIRFAVLTERGPDTDYAPETRSGGIGSSSWLPRG